MKATEFCYWLQGLFEMAEPVALTEKQTAMVRQHLAMVFKHEIDPSYGNAAHQADLSAIHKPSPGVPPHTHMGDVLLRC